MVNMSKIRNQVIYNLKKDRSSFVSFGIIILITALILSCAAVLLLQVDGAYDDKRVKLDTAGVNAIVPAAQGGDAEKALGALDAVESLESHKATLTEATVKDFNGADFTMNTVFYSLDDARAMNRFDLVEKLDREVENPIYVPGFVANFGGFPVGEQITYVINGVEHRFTVAGVIDEMQYGNYGSDLLCAYLPREGFDTLSEELGDAHVTEISVMVKAGNTLKTVKESVSKALQDQSVMLLFCLDADSVKETRTMVSTLLVLILAAFAAIILAVSVFLSNFRVKNALESEIVNMSVLKALGYTSGQIVAGITVPYAAVSLVFAMVGAAASYALLPVLIDVLGIQSGFTFDVRFDAVSFFGVTAVLAGVVTVFTWLSAGKIKKTQPIDGLRGNTAGKHGKKNHFPLDETRGNTKVLLVLKQIFACRKQNVTLALVSFVLTVLVAFSGTLFYNVAIKPDNFMRALSDENPDVIIQVCADRTDDILAVLETDNRVENALQYLSGSVKMEETTIPAFGCSDFSKVRNDVCYAGRNPEAAHEIALGSAFAGNYKIGDSVCVTVGDTAREFKVVGFVQSVNQNGELCELSLEGFRSLFETARTPDIYVYLANAADAAAVAQEYKTSYEDLVAATIDARKMMAESQKMYMDITVILVVVIFVVTILIVLFILYIVIKSLLVKRRQELGIYKAMGYTSTQLMIQTAGSFLPVSIAAILLSSVLALSYMPGIFDLIFRALGVMKNHMEVSFGFLMLFAAIQIAINMIISFLLCMPIRKISAYALIKE